MSLRSSNLGGLLHEVGCLVVFREYQVPAVGRKFYALLDWHEFRKDAASASYIDVLDTEAFVSRNVSFLPKGYRAITSLRRIFGEPLHTALGPDPLEAEIHQPRLYYFGFHFLI